jgi:hypothetical protein
MILHILLLFLVVRFDLDYHSASLRRRCAFAWSIARLSLDFLREVRVDSGSSITLTRRVYHPSKIDINRENVVSGYVV